MLIIEIALSVAAWRKGWKAWALLPLGVVIGIEALIWVAVGASGGSIEQAAPMLIGLDLVGMGVLIGLATREPHGAMLP